MTIQAKTITISSAAVVTLIGLAIIMSSLSNRSATDNVALKTAMEIEDIYTSPVMQIEVTDVNENGQVDTMEYETPYDAAVITGYSDSTIIQKIYNRDTLNGYSFRKGD